MKIYIRHPAGILAQLQLEEGREYSLGRASHNDVVIPSEYISRKHGRIYQQDGRWLYQDLRGAQQNEAIEIQSNLRIPLQVNIFLVTEEFLDTEATQFVEIQRPSQSQVQNTSIEPATESVSEISDEASNVQHEAVDGAARRSNVQAPSAVAVTLRQRMRELAERPEQSEEVVPNWKKQINRLLRTVPVSARKKFLTLAVPAAILFLFIIYQIFSALFEGSSVSLQQIHQEYLDRLFEIRSPRSCMAVKWDAQTVLTSATCVLGENLLEGSADFQITNQVLESVMPSRVLGLDLANDWILLEMPQQEMKNTPLKELAMTERKPRKNEVFFALGKNKTAIELVFLQDIQDSREAEVQSLEFALSGDSSSAAVTEILPGSPVVDQQGKMVALIQHSGPGNAKKILAVTPTQLQKGRQKYLKDQSKKRLRLELSRARAQNFHNLLKQFYLPDLANDAPATVLEPLSKVIAIVNVPAALEDFHREVKLQILKSVESRHEEVLERMSDQQVPANDWLSQLNHRVPAIRIQSEPWKEKWLERSTANKKPPVSLIGQPVQIFEPMKIADYQLFWGGLENVAGQRPEYQPNRLEFKELRKDSDYSLHVLLENSGEGRAFWAFRQASMNVTPQDIQSALAPSGMSAVKLENQESIEDGQARRWRLDQWQGEIEGRKIHQDIYCQSLPSGLYCRSQLQKDADKEWLTALRRNFQNHQLGSSMDPAVFWSLAEWQKFFDQGESSNLMSSRDVFLKQKKGELSLSLRTLGVNFRFSTAKFPLALRFIPGVYLEKSGMEGKDRNVGRRWATFAFEALYASKGGWQICSAGLEMKDSFSSPALNKVRLEQAIDGIWAEDIVSKRTEMGLTLYGYCAPLKGSPDSGWELDFGERRPFQPNYKLLDHRS